MIADIFYPISTLTITILVYFIQEKNCSGDLHPHLNQGITQGPLGAYSSPQSPSCNRFWLCRKPMHPYFFCIIPSLIFFKCSISCYFDLQFPLRYFCNHYFLLLNVFLMQNLKKAY